jgi:hypothetical protein
MIPKEKAKELLEKYDFIYTYDGLDIMDEDLTLADRKECAIITVDEIIQAMDNVMLPNPFKQYWNKVKQEIQKL